jgi:prolyl-tRNA editing enzyme YbaK/EbsC (Cys-tRNA(Pro) deacylase)
MAHLLLPQIQAALHGAEIVYRSIECDPKLADTAAFCAEYGFGLEQSANTIIVASKSEPRRYGCCVVLATTRLDVNKKVRELMGGRKVSFAPMETALELTGMEYGGVTAFGLPADMPIYVDAAVMDQSEIVMGGGNRSSKVLLQPAELRKLPGVQVVKGLAKAKEVQ